MEGKLYAINKKTPRPKYPEDYIVVKYEILQKTEFNENNNKYYVIELHKISKDDKKTSFPFRVYTHYGRTDDLVSNPQAGRRECRFYSTLANAEKFYASQLKQKLSAAKNYKQVAMSASSVGSEKLQQMLGGGSATAAASSGDSGALGSTDPDGPLPPYDPASSLSAEVQQLVNYLFSEATSALTQQVAARITARGLETPLGVLGMAQIEKGEAVLREIHAVLTGNADGAQARHDRDRLRELSGQFYTIIPHRIGRSKAGLAKAVIDSAKLLEEKQELLQLMQDLLSVNEDANAEPSSRTATAIDNKYKALKCVIHAVPESSSEFHHVAQQVVDSQIATKNVEVVRVFQVARPVEREQFTKLIGNRQQLFHGSRVGNFLGILSRGLLEPKLIVAKGGQRTNFGWLGAGIYFGNAACTSVKYSSAGRLGTRFLLVNDVALGRVKQYTKITADLHDPPPGYNSTHGVRHSPQQPSDFEDDEFVVYSRNQQKMCYLVEYRVSGSDPIRAVQVVPATVSTDATATTTTAPAQSESSFEFWKCAQCSAENTANSLLCMNCLSEKPGKPKKTLEQPEKGRELLLDVEPRLEPLPPATPISTPFRPNRFAAPLEPSPASLAPPTPAAQDESKFGLHLFDSRAGSSSSSRDDWTSSGDDFGFEHLKLSSGGGGGSSSTGSSSISISGGPSLYSIPLTNYSADGNTRTPTATTTGRTALTASFNAGLNLDSGWKGRHPLTASFNAGFNSSSDDHDDYSSNTLLSRTADADDDSWSLSAGDQLIKDREDEWRRRFVSDRTDPELRGPGLLFPVYESGQDWSYRVPSNNRSVHRDPYPLVMKHMQKIGNSTEQSIVSEHQFKKKWDKFSGSVLNGLNWNNVLLAGGAVLACVLPSTDDGGVDDSGGGSAKSEAAGALDSSSFSSSDLDLFIYGLSPAEATLKVKEIYECVSKNHQLLHQAVGNNNGVPQQQQPPPPAPIVLRTGQAITIAGNFPQRHVQIVLRLYLSPAEVLMGFDIDSCAIGFNGTQVLALPRTKRAITARFNLVDMSRRSLTYEVRLYKYAKRGFAVAVPGLRRDKVDFAALRRNPATGENPRGLARLLQLEYRSLRKTAALSPLRSGFTGASRLLAMIRRKAPAGTDERWLEWEAAHSSSSAAAAAATAGASDDDDQFESDYADVFIPWGPQWVGQRIVELLQQRDRAQFFDKRRPGGKVRHRHFFTAGIDNVLSGKSLWCKICQKQRLQEKAAQEAAAVPNSPAAAAAAVQEAAANKSEQVDKPTKLVAGPVKWLTVDPGRQLLSGSFHPVDDDQWESLAYGESVNSATTVAAAVSGGGAIIANAGDTGVGGGGHTDQRMINLSLCRSVFAAGFGDGRVDGSRRQPNDESIFVDAHGRCAEHYAAAAGCVSDLDWLRSDRRLFDRVHRLHGGLLRVLNTLSGGNSVSAPPFDQLDSALEVTMNMAKALAYFGAPVDDSTTAALLDELSSDDCEQVCGYAALGGHDDWIRVVFVRFPNLAAGKSPILRSFAREARKRGYLSSARLLSGTDNDDAAAADSQNDAQFHVKLATRAVPSFSFGSGGVGGAVSGSSGYPPSALSSLVQQSEQQLHGHPGIQLLNAAARFDVDGIRAAARQLGARQPPPAFHFAAADNDRGGGGGPPPITLDRDSKLTAVHVVCSQRLLGPADETRAAAALAELIRLWPDHVAAVDAVGATPLHYCQLTGNVHCAELLLAAADTTNRPVCHQRTLLGHTAFDYLCMARSLAAPIPQGDLDWGQAPEPAFLLPSAHTVDGWRRMHRLIRGQSPAPQLIQYPIPAPQSPYTQLVEQPLSSAAVVTPAARTPSVWTPAKKNVQKKKAHPPKSTVSFNFANQNHQQQQQQQQQKQQQQQQQQQKQNFGMQSGWGTSVASSVGWGTSFEAAPGLFHAATTASSPAADAVRDVSFGQKWTSSQTAVPAAVSDDDDDDDDDAAAAVHGRDAGSASEDVGRLLAPARSSVAKLLLLTSYLFKTGWLTQQQRSGLKDLVLSTDDRVVAVFEAFEINGDLLDFYESVKILLLNQDHGNNKQN